MFQIIMICEEKRGNQKRVESCLHDKLRQN